MAIKANYHTHTTASDGKLSPEELVKLAIEKKFDVLGITDHYRFPFGFRDWGNDYYSDDDYEELKRLRNKYSGKIKVLINVEFDWLEDYKEWTFGEAVRRKYDYRFVSVHFLKIGEEYYPFEHSEEIFKDMIKKIGGVDVLIKSYYEEIRSAVKSGFFEVVSHLDLIKFWNKDGKYFSEKEDWYREEVLKTLRVVLKFGLKLDLNFKATRKPCGEQCPSDWIVTEAKKMGILFLPGTDAHNGGELEFGLEKIEALMK